MIQKEKIRGVGYFLMALATGLLPFAAPDACAQALREGLALCGGPLLLSLFPFLIVSTLLIQCPAADVLGLPFCPVARLIGVRAPAAGRVLLIGSLGGFAPAASAVAGAVRSGQLTAREADALLPACVCSGPSFVILAVGQSMLGSAELGVLLFLAQVAAGYLSAALLARLGGTLGSMAHPAVPTASQPLRLDGIIAQASQTYLKLCGFVLFFRMLAAGAGEALPSGAGVLCAMLLEVCSGCDLAAKSGRFASMLCCAALSGAERAGAFCSDAGADHLPARDDPPPALPRPAAPSAAFAVGILSSPSSASAGDVQHPVRPRDHDAPPPARLCADGVSRLLLCGL